MKKKIVIVLAVVLTLTLLLTSVALADIGHKHVICYPWGGVKVSNWLDMYYYDNEEPQYCGPKSGVSIGRYYREALDLDGDQGVVTITEDFEWGSVGTSLGVEPPLGDVDWTVSASGGSYAQIDDGAGAQLGIKGAKFYRDGTNSILASYPCNPADYLGFYVNHLS